MNIQLIKLVEKYNKEPLDDETKLVKILEDAYNLGISQAFISKSQSTNKEDIYDKDIAPLLKLAGERCTEAKIPFVSVAEYAKSSRGSTFYLPEGCDLSMIMLSHCAKMGTNLDGYVMGLVNYAKEKGIDYSSSFVMKTMAGEK